MKVKNSKIVMRPKFPKYFKFKNLISLNALKPEKIPKKYKSKFQRQKIIFLSQKIYIYLRQSIPGWRKLPVAGKVAKNN